MPFRPPSFGGEVPERPRSKDPHPHEQKRNENLGNPNSIGELISLGADLKTRSDRVYRSVHGPEAVEDLFTSGVVRNAQTAGKVKDSRYGDRVFWSRGDEGKYHIVQTDTFVIEAPYEIASQRQVTDKDVSAIYGKTAEGVVEDILPGKKAKQAPA